MKSLVTTALVPDRLRGAGLVMLVGTLPWVLMPLAPAFGADVSRGIGITFGGGSSVVVTTAMLPWLAPLSLATTLSGLLVYYGRGLILGLALAIAWTIIGLASMSGGFVIAAIVAYCIFTGRPRLDVGAEGPQPHVTGQQ